MKVYCNLYKHSCIGKFCSASKVNYEKCYHAKPNEEELKMELTISDALNLMKEIKSRIRSLEALRDRVSVTERFYNASDKVKEPEYSVQKVDDLLVRLNKLQFELNNKIKTTNARVVIKGEFDTAVVFEQLN